MTKLTCWTMALVGILLLPSVVVSADAAAEAYQKGKARLEKADVDSAIAAFTEATVRLGIVLISSAMVPVRTWLG